MAAADASKPQIGLYGLAVMGQNLALNIADNGIPIAVCNRSKDKAVRVLGLPGSSLGGSARGCSRPTGNACPLAARRCLAQIAATVARAKAEGDLPLTGIDEVGDFVKALSKPRTVIILVKAGKPVDASIELLAEHMEEGDLIIDGGNEWFPNSVRRAEALAAKKIDFIGMGVSGGEEGARYGPSLMPGGPRAAYDRVEPILTKISAKTDSGPCVTYVGEIGAGNHVKM
ncbi:pgdC, partial [Symbiodinium sp. KB8]